MSGALLDSHALYWLVTQPERLSLEALLAIAESGRQSRLYVSPISVWELTTAALKPPVRNPPELGTGAPGIWFREAFAAIGSRIVPIREKIAFEAAEVVRRTGHKDPGDCYVIATARVKNVPVVTRDRIILRLSDAGFVETIPC